MVVIDYTSIVQGGLDDLEAILGPARRHAQHGKAPEDDAGLGYAFKDQEDFHLSIVFGAE